MRNTVPSVIVAGHICLDVIPAFGAQAGSLEAVLEPGKLVNVGAAVTATGGAVANTGLALHRLGVPARLMGKVGDDLFGGAILDVLRSHDPALAAGMIVAPGEASSYTVVISPPGVDRVFLHCPGANDTFGADDVADEALAEARLFHFGYPPLMRRMYAGGGAELAALMERARAGGLVTSLDMAYPDPASEAGQVDWPALLRRILPHVDLFLPSLDELLFMLDRKRFLALSERGDLLIRADGALLADLAGRLIDMGVAAAVIKLGSQGLYLRTSADAGRRLGLDEAAAPRWAHREMLAPCFRVESVGTTGAGDCTIAGFLAGILQALPPEAVMTHAVAVGACSVESPDATSGVPDWDTVRERLRSGWARRDVVLRLDGWRWDAAMEIWRGPHDGVPVPAYSKSEPAEGT